jgi:hypothetical protein
MGSTSPRQALELSWKGREVGSQPDTATADSAPPPPDQRQPVYAIASRGFFQRRFGGGDPAVLGQPVVKKGPVLGRCVLARCRVDLRPDKNVERHADLWASPAGEQCEEARHE